MNHLTVLQLRWVILLYPCCIFFKRKLGGKIEGRCWRWCKFTLKQQAGWRQNPFIPIIMFSPFRNTVTHGAPHFVGIRFRWRYWFGFLSPHCPEMPVKQRNDKSRNVFFLLLIDQFPARLWFLWSHLSCGKTSRRCHRDSGGRARGFWLIADSRAIKENWPGSSFTSGEEEDKDLHNDQLFDEMLLFEDRRVTPVFIYIYVYRRQGFQSLHLNNTLSWYLLSERLLFLHASTITIYKCKAANDIFL